MTIRLLFDKFVELCNKSIKCEYFFLTFGYVIYLPDVNTLFKFQLSYNLSFSNIGYYSTYVLLVAGIHFLQK